MISSRYILTRLDKRFAGSHAFQYRVDMHGKQSLEDKITLYRDMREWCLQSYGSSVDLPHHRILHRRGIVCNPHWAFWTRDDFHQLYVFLATDKEMAIFQLRF